MKKKLNSGFLLAILFWMHIMKFKNIIFFNSALVQALTIWIKKKIKLCLHYLTHYTQYPLHSLPKWPVLIVHKVKRGRIHKKNFKFHIDNFQLKISFKLSFCLGFANINSQTNKLLSVLTLHCTVYTLQYVPYIWELSKPETSQGWGPKSQLGIGWFW